MMPGSALFERRLKTAGALILLGLLVEIVCLVWKGPLAFLVFISVGGLFVVLGIVAYLLSLLSSPSKT